MKTEEIDVVLFDWGGTLAMVENQMQALKRGAGEVLELLIGESMPEIVEFMVTAAREAEQQASRDPEHREVDLRELMRNWATQFGVPVTETQLSQAMAAIGRNWVGAALKVVPGASRMLKALRAKGLRIGLVSNCFIPPEYCHDELRHQGLADLLDAAVFSSGVGVRKPSPRIYEAALQAVAVNGEAVERSRVLFVGDSPAYDVIAPAGLGMKTALVASVAGFWPESDHERAKPDVRINSVVELAEILGANRE